AMALYAELFRAAGLFRRLEGVPPDAAGAVPRAAAAPASAPPGWIPPALVALGAALLALPLAWPRWFYPLVWGSLVLLLEPLNRRLGGRTFLFHFRRGGARELALWLLSGAASGFTWELLNYWARVKWVYTVPFFEEL